jgi:hypothetical protein
MTLGPCLPDSQKPRNAMSLKMSRDTGSGTGCIDIPPYVTIVPPSLHVRVGGLVVYERVDE